MAVGGKPPIVATENKVQEAPLRLARKPGEPVLRDIDTAGDPGITFNGDVPEGVDSALWLPKIVSGLAQMPRWVILASGCLTS